MRRKEQDNLYVSLNFRPIFYFSSKHVVDTEMVLLSTKKRTLRLMNKKMIKILRSQKKVFMLTSELT